MGGGAKPIYVHSVLKSVQKENTCLESSLLFTYKVTSLHESQFSTGSRVSDSAQRF